MKIAKLTVLKKFPLYGMYNFTELPIKVQWVGIFKSTYTWVKAKTAYLSKVRTPSNDDDTASTEW